MYKIIKYILYMKHMNVKRNQYVYNLVLPVMHWRIIVNMSLCLKYPEC